ncbi:MAG: hypothetical protein LBQ66_16345 [Planctomycetaceae bacterium]|nr:hypothetical protein [Planctomycetaceae bacterium]
MANVLQHVLVLIPNSFGFLMHRGGRDARVPVRAASRRTTRGKSCHYRIGVLVLVKTNLYRFTFTHTWYTILSATIVRNKKNLTT